MKSLLFLSILMLAFLFVKFPLKKAQLNSVLFVNVEALATPEYDMPHHCWGTGSVDCPISKVNVKYVASGYSLKE